MGFPDPLRPRPFSASRYVPTDSTMLHRSELSSLNGVVGHYVSDNPIRTATVWEQPAAGTKGRVAFGYERPACRHEPEDAHTCPVGLVSGVPVKFARTVDWSVGVTPPTVLIS